MHVAHGLTPAQVKTYRLLDNRSHEETDWDLELLAPELADLQLLDIDLELTGFDTDEIDEALSSLDGVAHGLTDDDAAPEVPVCAGLPTW